VAIFIHKFAPSSQSLGFQCSVVYGGLNSAAGFMCMSAIAEPAKRSQLRNFREQGADAMGRIADVERAYARRINHPATARNGAAIFRLVGAILLEQNDEWAVQRGRYMTLETIAPLSDTPIVGLPAVAT